MITGLLPMLLVLHAAPTSIASPAWRTVQVPEDLAAFYADRVAQALRGHGFRVVTSSEIAALLSNERQKELLGCADGASSCMAELGAALGCDATLLVSVARLEDEYQAQLKVLKSTDGTVLAETRAEANGQKAFGVALDEAAERLAQGLSGSTPAGELRATASRGGARRFWWVPAVVAGAGAAAAVAGFVDAGNTYSSLSMQLQAGLLDASSGDARALAQHGQTAQLIGWVGVGVGAAALVGLGALLLFGDAPVQPTVSLAPGAAGLGLSGRLP